MRGLRRTFHLLAQTTVVIAAATYGGNVLADVSKNDEISVDVGVDASIKPLNTNDDVFEPPSDTSYMDECGVWLAPSTIPGAGLGIFSGRDFKKKEELMPSGDVVVPINDIMMHQKGRKFVFLWDEYTWNGKSLGLGHEVVKECNAASPGFGAAANSFLDLINVNEGDPENDIPHGLHRSKDPGVGAFTTYHNRKAHAKINIKAGQELFVNYGQHWFEQRTRLGPIPLRRGLKQSTNFYRKYQQLQANHPQVKQAVYEELWDTFVKHTAFNESRIFGAFTHSKYERDNLNKNYTLNQIRRKESTRSLDWLKEHGTCADNIREGLSTIRQAGRGAFSTRRLPKGALVAHMPIIHISDRGVLEMYKLSEIKTKKRSQRALAGYQLLANYCYSHTNTTLMLCPYSPMTGLVNHNQTIANVKLVWSDAKRGNHEPELLEKTVEEFSKDRTAKLAMDLVAIRDIQEGEEIFLDAGDAFETAWNSYARNWKPVEGASNYISAYQLNQEVKNGTFRTEFEQTKNPYPGNVNIECDSEIWTGIDQTLYQTTGEINVTKPDRFEYWNCDILRRREVNGTIRYTVIVSRPPETKKKNKKKEDKDEKPLEKFVKLTDIPQMAIRFTDRPYTTDMFLPTAFRHPYQIPEHLFPEKWKNWSPAPEAFLGYYR